MKVWPSLALNFISDSSVFAVLVASNMLLVLSHHGVSCWHAISTFPILSPADYLHVTVILWPSVSELLFKVSFHRWLGVTAGCGEPSLLHPPHPPFPLSLTSGNFYSCHLLSQMTQLSFQLPSKHPAPSPSLSSSLSPVFFSILTHNRNEREGSHFFF